MMIRYLQPIRELENLRRQMDLVFDELSAQTAQTNDTSTAWVPAVELIDTGDNLVFYAQLPGVAAKNLDIQVTRDAVAIAGERQRQHQSENANYLHSEFRYGKFQRVVNLPVAVQNDKVQADFRDGILTLTLPKVEQVRNRVVKINLGESTADAEKSIDTTAQTVNSQN
ncbi:heat-shock protein Hsp20 [Fischerella major NIES-592]|uniref:Heat-shock protein Hsp20 n=2 Tax=Fischerella TaxID=1190 RepID=A0A1U7GWU5_9CYAN|nr:MULTISPECIES: Hsp20/alpha crystallin family protein [Fischerella]OKH12770.1 heat-shock protein Hsp20 [Fischerella major NIES-592]PMB46752.1 Hsp20/alpha crystallin family protein [Fischerella thermalis CCMEE 5330]BAU05388.1 heat shock protein Hsp20 [Fischerella sp. NIES-3754]BCX07649.1 MAG: molecular chaperone [Fischerella sp.]